MGTRMLWRGLAVAWTMAFATHLAACGADTGLRVPDASACGVETLRSGRHTSEVIFVVDRSGSMRYSLDGVRGGESRWGILRDALARTLPAYEGSLAMGAALLPSRSMTSLRSATG